MARKKQFKAESKRLLDLMINSIYTNKEIFLRELISNASDAIDKLYYESLSEGYKDVDRDGFEIRLSANKEARTLTIEDNGIGMRKEELEENLGTIAKSGSQAFKTSMEENEEIDIIGQFGVGFYAAFMVAENIEVYSKSYGEDVAHVWKSNAHDGYTIEECDKDTTGTKIVLYLKENDEDENYDTYLQDYELESLVKKYSDYIRYPIRMMVTEQKPIEKENEEDDVEFEEVQEDQTLNSMVPLWKRPKKDITEEEYNDFYRSKFNDFENPMRTVHMNIEGTLSFTALLYIPSHVPYNYYQQDYKRGLQLYSRGVFIMDHAEELLPEHFRFVRGLVDSQDLSLNISREMLQQDRQLKVMASRIEKKIISELHSMMENEKEEYYKFWENFGLALKFGVYNSFGMNNNDLQDLLMFYSSKEMKLVSLDEYVERMEESQNGIYYASGSSVEMIDKLPQVAYVKDKGFEILYLKDDVDEFTLQALQSYKEHEFKNVTQDDLDLEDAEEKKKVEETSEVNKGLLEKLQEALDGKVEEVRLSTRLVDDAVCMASGEGMSFEMEKVLSAMPEGNSFGMKAKRILEINPKHAIFTSLQALYDSDSDKLGEYAEVLYEQAMMMEGFPVEDPIAYTKKLMDLLVIKN